MKRYYSITEVSNMMERSKQALHYWAKKSGVKRTKGGYKFTLDDISIMEIRLNTKAECGVAFLKAGCVS